MNQSTHHPIIEQPEVSGFGTVPRVKGGYLNLSPYLPYFAAERPTDWDVFFGRSAPMELEIGFGNGEFLVRNAADNPDRNFLGIELTWASVRRALRRTAQQNLSNIAVTKCDAQVVLSRLFRPKSISRIYSLFPVPWPKERHARRRLFSTQFLRLAASRLRDGGEMQIVTDFEPLFQWVLEQVPGSGFRAESEFIPARFQTKYERKWQEDGQETFFEIKLLKEENVEIPLPKETVLFTYKVSGFNPEEFKPTGQRGPITVDFEDYVYDPVRRKALVLAMVAEDRLIQNIWIEIMEDEGRWVIRAARGSNAMPTMGLQRALELVRDAII